jgi:hypothetical protein
MKLIKLSVNKKRYLKQINVRNSKIQQETSALLCRKQNKVAIVDTVNVKHSISCVRIPYHDMLFAKDGTHLALILEAFHWSGSLDKTICQY